VSGCWWSAQELPQRSSQRIVCWKRDHAHRQSHILQQEVSRSSIMSIVLSHVLSLRRTRCSWHPNVQRKSYKSPLLGTSLTLRLTTSAMRCIDKAGGLDPYILHTPETRLDSKLAIALKDRMVAILKKYPELNKPQKALRLPKHNKQS